MTNEIKDALHVRQCKLIEDQLRDWVLDGFKIIDVHYVKLFSIRPIVDDEDEITSFRIDLRKYAESLSQFNDTIHHIRIDVSNRDLFQHPVHTANAIKKQITDTVMPQPKPSPHICPCCHSYNGSSVSICDYCGMPLDG